MYSFDSQKELVDAIWRMAYIAEYREGGNLGHLERVRGYAQVIARGLELPQNEVQIISVASQLHDIGKIGLPETLLLQQGNYTAADLETIKRHTVIGAELLKNSPSVVIQAGESIAKNHHERWDGSGYPNELRGEQIPLGARICAIADVFDALTTPRSYKKEVPAEDALRLIRDAGGSLFDPQLVKVFNAYSQDVLRIVKTPTKSGF